MNKQRIQKDNIYIPIYIQISQKIRQMITSGYYQEDDQIPSEEEIVNTYGVSRMTARNAVTELVNEGLVYRVHGKGAFVARTKLNRHLNKITGFHEDMHNIGLKPSSKVINFEKRRPTEKEGNILKIDKLNMVFEIKRIRYVVDVPYGFQKVIVPEYLVPKLYEVDLEKESLYSYLNLIGKPLVTSDQRMEAVMNTEIAELINIPDTIPFFFFERTSFLENQTPVELLQSYFRGDKFSYTMHLSN